MKSSAVIYARVSSTEQEKEGFSIDAQLKLLREYASAEEFSVLEEFVEVETAKQAGRPAFSRMLSVLRAARPTPDILVEKTDRLYRNIRDWVTLDDLNARVHMVKEGHVIAPDSRSDEKFMRGIKVLMAKNYVDNLSEETKKGMLEKASQGIWPSFAPIGYRNVVGPSGKRIIEPDPERGPVVARLFSWYATGRYSLDDLSRLASEAGLTGPKAGCQ